MAEGLAKYFNKKTDVHFYSAGIEKHGLNPNAVKVMSEIDIDITHHESKTLDMLGDIEFDVIFTVCGHADKTCPVLDKKTRKIHVGFDDPPTLAKNAINEEAALNHYRRVRDEIKQFVMNIENHW